MLDTSCLSAPRQGAVNDEDGYAQDQADENDDEQKLQQRKCSSGHLHLRALECGDSSPFLRPIMTIPMLITPPISIVCETHGVLSFESGDESPHSKVISVRK